MDKPSEGIPGWLWEMVSKEHPEMSLVKKQALAIEVLDILENKPVADRLVRKN